MDRGIFITFEGIDGSGKTTQLRMLAGRLRQTGREVVEAVEPWRDGDPDVRSAPSCSMAATPTSPPSQELLLYFAEPCAKRSGGHPAGFSGRARSCFAIASRIRPWCTRARGRGLGADVVLSLQEVACQGLQPDLTVFVDIDLDQSHARARGRNISVASSETRLDDESHEFHRAVRDAYLALAARESKRFLVIDGNLAGIEEVEARVWKEVSHRV